MLKYLLLIFMLIGCSNNEKLSKEQNHLMLRGVNSSVAGNNLLAIKYYEEILKDNRNKMVLEEIGLLYAKMGELNKAESFLKEAYDKNSRNTLVLRNLGYINYSLKNYKESIKYLKKIDSFDLILQDKKILANSYFQEKEMKESFNIIREIENQEIINSNELFIIYLEYLDANYSFEDKKNLLEKMVEVELKNKENTFLLVSIFKNKYMDYKMTEIVLKKYLLNNSLDKEVLEELADIYLITNQTKNYENIKKLL